MEKKMKAVVVYSGGMDSFTVLHKAIAEGREVFPINFNYGQRHGVERSRALAVCESLGLQLKEVDITALKSVMNQSALTDDIDVPKGHYEDENMKLTVVPNRNMILLSIAAAYAVTVEANELWYGAHSGDHAIYPDCRPEFAYAMHDALQIANYEPIALKTPFLDGDKETILDWGLAQGLDYGMTWTCYDPQHESGFPIHQAISGGRVLACGKCGSCTERLEAFAAHGVEDPVEYI